MSSRGRSYDRSRNQAINRAISSPEKSQAAGRSRTQEIFEQVDKLNFDQGQAGGAGGRTTYQAFQAVDEAWARLRNMKTGAEAGPAPQFVKEAQQPLKAVLDYDVAVCGGTLGIFLAAALAQRGWRVAVLERGPLRGRAQEWNISRLELRELVSIGLFTAEEVESCIAMEFNPVRAGFYGGKSVWTRDVLNLGANPIKLIALARQKLEAAGGKVYEGVALEGLTVHPDGAALALRSGPAASPSSNGNGGSRLTAGLVLDCMGHMSPIVQQLRWGNKPDGVCLVVGGLASGPWPDNSTADVIATASDMQPLEGAPLTTTKLQYFWEAFPAGTGAADRTTYMFTYLDAAPWRPSLAAVMDDYWNLMPAYQNVKLEDLTFKRVLFGLFPTFRSSPLRPGFDRVVQVGDASGIQSPLSFGGFGALTRHIRRLLNAFDEALKADCLDRDSLSLVHAYNPGLSSAWMLQRAMSVRQGERVDPRLINRMLSANFGAMEHLGTWAMKPFLQDVIQLGPLMATLAQQMIRDPGVVPQLLMHVGVEPMLDWAGHASALASYSALHSTSGPLRALAPRLPPRQRYRVNRMLDAWEFGSGADYKLPQQ